MFLPELYPSSRFAFFHRVEWMIMMLSQLNLITFDYGYCEQFYYLSNDINFWPLLKTGLPQKFHQANSGAPFSQSQLRGTNLNFMCGTMKIYQSWTEILKSSQSWNRAKEPSQGRSPSNWGQSPRPLRRSGGMLPRNFFSKIGLKWCIFRASRDFLK